MSERRSDRFIRIAESRTQNVLDDIAKLSKCSDPAVYAYTDTQVEKIFSAIQNALDAARYQFDHKGNRFVLSAEPEDKRGE